MIQERTRLAEEAAREKNWRRWGPYLSERQWGTVREDYSADGNSWGAFPHDHARSRAYRWGEDGLQGWCDRQCRLCFSPALWNGQDDILKERLFGLTGPEGNHGEDVKECYYYLDSTPTHSYTKALYKYPQAKFPYVKLRDENGKRGYLDRELELADTGAFQDGRYFDVLQEVAKRSPQDLLWKISLTNRGPETAEIHLLPHLWFRNTWKWGNEYEEPVRRPDIRRKGAGLEAQHGNLGKFRFYASLADQACSETAWLFTENETNYPRVFKTPGPSPYVKDAFHRHLINQEVDAINPEEKGTKATAHFKLLIAPGETVVVHCRLHELKEDNGFQELDHFEETFAERIAEANEFYQEVIPRNLSAAEENMCRQGYAGLLWTKQFFYYVIKDWLKGDRDGPPPPYERLAGRNSDWSHFFARDILSMPDKWEYPWFAAWDTAFHMIPFAVLDPGFTKHQLLLLLREWYMHPNGQLPAYEWNFSDVNPPVHAWAVWRVYKIADRKGQRDLDFLERCFQKLLINFTWWVNRKDVGGRHVFGGGFLGLDNIGVFDRSHSLPSGSVLQQADGTAWMGSYCLTMLAMALELAPTRPPYEDIASKFLEHFVSITDAMNSLGGSGLWDEEDGFYYDNLIVGDDKPIPMKIRSLVGLLPMIGVTVLKQKTIDALPGFRRRMDWFLTNQPELLKYINVRRAEGEKNPNRVLLAIPPEDRFLKTLKRLLDPQEFLSDYGIRSLSKAHGHSPFVFEHQGKKNTVSYVPGESDSGMFGGNSNWRGPIWFPTNFLIIEALERYYYFYGDSLQVEYPTGSGQSATLREVAIDLCDRLISLFLPDENGRRPCNGDDPRYKEDEHWKELVLFYEYFHGETGEGLGASHQTGWTSLVVRLVRERREKLASCQDEWKKDL
ncbi:MGH1-like glycoside hydrolase domain-containing protein [Roseibacillus ishigakijimensis]|uniref:Glucosidase n=1 Tax=Roseibacillus ishigakijimensis TaxID=454146 RepID=A0A934RNB6_9BACT|nr:glucosidase [Roseibacillus ishigakijimensis]MBK1832541.1 glucosidase [Roseibacillus ishigakijimensis]